MKKITFIVATVFAASVLFTSCKKDYTCTCTVGGSTSAVSIKDAKKKDAKDACDALDAAAKIGGGSCSL